MDSNQLRFLSAGFTVRCPSAVRAALPKLVDLWGIEPRISPCKGDVLPLALEAHWGDRRILKPQHLAPQANALPLSYYHRKLGALGEIRTHTG